MGFGGRQSIGFGAHVQKAGEAAVNAVRHVEPADLVKFGLIPEFVGRFPAVVSLDVRAGARRPLPPTPNRPPFPSWPRRWTRPHWSVC